MRGSFCSTKYTQRKDGNEMYTDYKMVVQVKRKKKKMSGLLRVVMVVLDGCPSIRSMERDTEGRNTT